MHRLAVFVAALLLVAGCSTGNSAQEQIQVQFDGVECSVTGPDSLPAGTTIGVTLANSSTTDVAVALARLHPHAWGESYQGQHERTYADLAQHQNRAAGFIWEDLDDPAEHPANWMQRETVVYSWEGEYPSIGVADDRSLTAYRLGTATGTDVIYLTTQGEIDPQHQAKPDGYWFCAPIDITPTEFG